MSDRQDVEIRVMRQDHWDLDDSAAIPRDLNKVAAWAQEMLKEIPAEYRATAQLEIDSEGGYEGEHHVVVSIRYRRPETDAEMAQRQQARLNYIEGERRRLGAQLERLGG